MNKAQPITTGIKYSGFSGFSSVSSRIKFCIGGYRRISAIRSISYPQPLATSECMTTLQTDRFDIN